MINDSLGDRIKRYEASYNHKAVQRMPLIIRVDGKAFHTLLRKAKKPFDENVQKSMLYAAKALAKEIQGFKAAYIQSDEATFVMTDYDTLNTCGWFNYEINKIISITASTMSVAFSRSFRRDGIFDSRIFSVPKDDVANVFLWRARDWHRNSIQMYARSFFSNRELHGKKIPEIHEMLFAIGKNWSECKNIDKNGVFIFNEENEFVISDSILPKYKDIAERIEPLIEPLVTMI